MYLYQQARHERIEYRAIRRNNAAPERQIFSSDRFESWIRKIFAGQIIGAIGGRYSTLSSTSLMEQRLNSQKLFITC